MSKGFPCPNCKEYTKDGHFAPPSLGYRGFYICKFNLKRPRPDFIRKEVSPGVLRSIPNPDKS